MNRAAKVASFGILIMYTIAVGAAAYWVAVTYFNVGTSDHDGLSIGDYQAAILAAYDRVEEKQFFLSAAAPIAIKEGLSTLYEQNALLLTPAEGEGGGDGPCGGYLYALWNDETESCVTKESFSEPLSREIQLALDAQTLTHPERFTQPYTITTEERENLLVLLFTASQRIEEPILLNVGRFSSVTEVEEVFTGSKTQSGMGWPSTGEQRVTSCFGPRQLSNSAGDTHYGLDIPAGGQAIAVLDGTVINNVAASKYGVVWIEHSPTLSTRYMHMEDILVAEGDVVKAGQPIGTPSGVGPDGPDDYAKHLHFEVLVKPLLNTAHAYQGGSTAGWSSVNPVCFLDMSEITMMTAPNSCELQRRAGLDPKESYCDEYGFELVETASPSQRPETELPSQSAPVVGPDANLFTNTRKAFDTNENLKRFGWGDYVIEASVAHGVDQSLLFGVITQESEGIPDLISTTGCIGLMQLCYSTAQGTEYHKQAPTGLTLCPACTAENDWRFDQRLNVLAGAQTLQRKLRFFDTYTDRLKFGVAAYNIGEGIVKDAISGTGKGDPSWEEVSQYLYEHPELVNKITWYQDKSDAERAKKVKEVRDYVPAVLDYATAWNEGVALDAGRDLGALDGARRLGTYSYDPSMRFETENALAPLFSLLDWANETIATCADAAVPGDCLTAAAEGRGAASCVTGPEAYFFSLYQAMRDCAENGQDVCQCALPVAQGISENLFSIDAREQAASLPGAEWWLGDLSEKNIMVNGIVPAQLEVRLTEEGAILTYRENLAASEGSMGDPVTLQPGWTLEKKDGHLLFRSEKEAQGLCAPVKSHYPLCLSLNESLPPVRFSLTLRDNSAPVAVTGVLFDVTTKQVSFTASSSEDLSFYNVYDEEPAEGVVPVLQMRVLSFDASPYLGKSLFIAPVDQAGQEGEAVSLQLPSP